MKEQIKKDLALLEQYKQLAKENNDIRQWRQLCKVVNNWKSYTQDIRDNILECVAKHACRYNKEN